jgi:DNA-binding NtrC family response regulator
MDPTSPGRILGSQLSEQESLISALAQSSEPILICGEEGVGKSLFAARIHAAGPHSKKPYHSINIAIAPEREQRLALFGSSYGHMSSTRRGLLERETTVLVKHIDHAQVWLQDELASAIQTGLFRRLGSSRRTVVSCRTLFTLRRPPEELSREGKLSTSICSLLSSVQRIVIPPLRDRPDDIVTIAEHILGSSLRGDLRDELLKHPWPANVSELKAYLACLQPLAAGGTAHDACYREVAKMMHRISQGEEFSLKDSLLLLEKNLIEYALRSTNGRCARAARLLGISDTSLRGRIERLRDFC